MANQKTKFWACGFDDQMPCARNRYNLGIGATIFIRKEDAEAFVAGKVISLCELEVDTKGLPLLVERHRRLAISHMNSLGCNKSAIDKELALFDSRVG